MANNEHGGADGFSLVAAGLIGGFLVARARRDESPLRAVVGLGCLAYAMRPSIERAIVRAGARRGAITLRTTIEVARPIHETFAFFRDFENLPHIIGSLRSVRDFQDGRSRWEAYGPSDGIVEWDAVTTKYVPQSVIAWASVPNSSVESRGLLRFFATQEGGTRVSVEFVYVPAETGIGEAVSALLTPARQSQMSSDLARAHFYLESLPPPQAREGE